MLFLQPSLQKNRSGKTLDKGEFFLSSILRDKGSFYLILKEKNHSQKTFCGYSVGTKRNKTPWITPGQDKFRHNSGFLLCCQMSQDEFVTNFVTVATKKGDYQSWDVSFLYFFCKTETYSSLQYFSNTFAILSQYFSNTFAILFQYFSNTFPILFQYWQLCDKVWVTDRYYLPLSIYLRCILSPCFFCKKLRQSLSHWQILPPTVWLSIY